MTRLKRGFTIIEVLISSGIFLIVVWLAFAAFEFGSRACSLSNLRANVQGSATRVILSLENDLRRSSYTTVTIANRSVTYAGQTYSRDALCMAAIANWNDPASFNSQFGFARYDRYVIYYATDDREDGRLIRSVVNSTGDPLAPAGPISGFTQFQNYNNDPALNQSPLGSAPGQINHTQLSEDVRSFAVTDGLLSQSVKASLTLFRAGLQGAGAKRVDQAFQMEIELVPQNTYPRNAN